MVSADRIFDAAFAAAVRDQSAAVVGEPYAGEFAFAGALRITADLLADAMSARRGRQRAARNRLRLLLAPGKEAS